MIDKLYYATEELRDDKDVIMEAVKNDGQILYYASERLRDDNDVVMEAIKNKPLIFKYASLRLRSDKEYAKLAITLGMEKAKRYIVTIYQSLSEELQSDEEIQKIMNPE